MQTFLPKIMAALLLATAVAPAQSTNIYLKLPGIPGASDAPGHLNEIVVQSVSFGANQKTVVAAGATGAGAGKSEFTVIEIAKLLDTASPLLFLNCALGKTLPTARLTFQHAGETPWDYFVLDLTNVIIANYTTSNGGDTPVESVGLSYSTIKVTYSPTQLGTPISANFDVVKNKSVTTEGP